MSEMASIVVVPKASAGDDADGQPFPIDKEDPTETERCCWICLVTDKEDGRLAWVNPCPCRGTSKWVHESCLFHWIDEKIRKESDLETVSCPQCQTQYNIIYPKLGIFASALELMNSLILRRLYKCLAPVFTWVCLYWLAITFGASTYMQIGGHTHRVHHVIRAKDPLVILIGFPLIPFGLILGRMIPWDDFVLRFIRKCCLMMRNFATMCLGRGYDHKADPYPCATMAPKIGSRVLCGALLLPTISLYVGRVLYSSVDDRLQQTLLGGLTFIAIKGIFKMYLKHKQYLRRMKSRILDYTDENLAESAEQ
ncbi:E3 ubiquitin-protein ligase MARCHF5 [Drosophila teissieri]|uniref:E3 ubiquitin-protein ligase MARCHF5 n=1 Tax=Drosophila teissieri TaxID=7243 RepID=UPI001CBA2457|nr:E3 ubiquitin-protein ligase MARCHF5 [Drosophila teissieri]